MKTNRLHRIALLALTALGFSISHANGQATSSNGELILGFRVQGNGAGNTINYEVDLGPASALRDETQVRTISLAGVKADLDTAYGVGWPTRTDLKWSVVGGTNKFTATGGDAAATTYATKAESSNGVLVSTSSANKPWLSELPDGQNGVAADAITGARTGFNNQGQQATNASAIAKTLTNTDTNSWTKYQPGGTLSGGPSLSFQTWTSAVEGNPTQYLDLIRMVPLLETDTPPKYGDVLGRLVLKASGDLIFIPAAIVGKSTMQFSSATYSAAEDAGTLTVTVTRTGDTTVGATINVSTVDGTGGSAATAPADYTAISNQAVTFAENETSKPVAITIVNRSGNQGSRSFTVTLNGADANNLIDLQGNRTATCTINEASLPSTVQLAATSYSVAQGAASVSIGLTRTGGSDSLSVTVTPSQDAGDFALAGTHYTAGAVTATFASNSNTASALIPLLGATSLKHLQFHVTVANVNVNDTNPTIGTPSKAAVVLLSTSADTGAPTVALAATPPLPNATTLYATTTSINESASHLVTVGGTATDDKGVISRVEIRLNGAAPVNASTLTGTSTGATFSHQITPIGGSNTVVLQSFDALGKASTPVTRTFTYVKKRNLALTLNPSNGGVVTGFKAASLTAPPYQVGLQITMTAKANPGFIFKNWTSSSTPAGLVGPATELAALNAIFTDTLATNSLSAVPNITANFIPNPFTIASVGTPNAVAGTFNGLIIADNTSTPSNSTNGMISNLVLTSAGTFTATLKVDGITALPAVVTGSFDPVTGVAKFGASRSTKLLVDRSAINKPSYELDLQLVAGSGVFATGSFVQQITGHLVQKYRSVTISSSNLTLDRAYYSSTIQVTDNAMLANLGKYNIAFPATTIDVPNTFIASDYPHGDGFGTLTITSAGGVTFTATLADGAKITSATSALSKTYGCALYAQLYTPTAAPGGSIGGNVTFAATTDTDVAGSDFFWFRPWQSNVQHYPWGWPEGITVDLVGTKLKAAAYTAAAPIIPGLPNSLNNATLTFSDGQLVPSSLFVAAKDYTITHPALTTVTVTNVPATDITSLKPTITAATATFTGKFVHSNGTTVDYFGAILQKGANSKGFGFFQTAKPTVIDGTGESGGVSLTHK